MSRAASRERKTGSRIQRLAFTLRMCKSGQVERTRVAHMHMQQRALELFHRDPPSPPSSVNLSQYLRFHWWRGCRCLRLFFHRASPLKEGVEP
uniref:Uncharacterized protein n=1 Tax=Oryza glumipatula TaxID=40148 RepID=A0A0D9YR82_9ORYZ